MGTVEETPVTLRKPHTHNGRRYAAGQTINFPTYVATWLIEQGIGAKAGSAEARASIAPRKAMRSGCCGRW